MNLHFFNFNLRKKINFPKKHLLINSDLAILFLRKGKPKTKMKKLFLSILSITFLVSTGKSQDTLNHPTPNPGFENWTFMPNSIQDYYDPNNWSSLNDLTFGGGIFTCRRTSLSHSGNFAVKLETDTIGLPFDRTAPGTITTGTFNIIKDTIRGGILYNLHPDSIAGWYKYYPQKGDSAIIEFYLLNGLSKVAQGAFTPKGTVSAFTRFSVPIIYTSSNTPDTSTWILSSGNSVFPKVGDSLIVDDISVITNPTGIKPIDLLNGISISPNPSHGFINLKNENNFSGTFNIINETGRIIKEFSMNGADQIFDINDLAAGYYFYAISDKKGNTAVGGKIFLQKN
jgi:hypothetical protein